MRKMKGPIWFLTLLLVGAASAQHQHGRSSGQYSGGSGSARSDDPASWDIRLSVPGEPELDYPVLYTIPSTSFTCQGKGDGYYADQEARCQVFRVCASNAPGGHYSFLCPNGTLFNQEVLVCDWWMNVRCSGLDSERLTATAHMTLNPGPKMMNDIQKMITYPVQNPLPKDYPVITTVMQVYNPPDDMMAMFESPEYSDQGQEILDEGTPPKIDIRTFEKGISSQNSYTSDTNFEQKPIINQYTGFVSNNFAGQIDTTLQTVKQTEELNKDTNTQQAIKITKQQYTYPSQFDKQYTLTVPQGQEQAAGPQRFIVNIPINIPAIEDDSKLDSLVGGEEQYQRQSALFQQDSESFQKQTSALQSTQGTYSQFRQQNAFNSQGFQKNNELNTFQQNNGGNQQQNVQTTNTEYSKTGNVDTFNQNQQQQTSGIDNYSQKTTGNLYSSKFNKDTAAFAQTTAQGFNHQVNNANIQNSDEFNTYKSTIIDSRDQINSQITPTAGDKSTQDIEDENYDQYRITSGVSPTTITDEENQGEFYSVNQQFGRPANARFQYRPQSNVGSAQLNHGVINGDEQYQQNKENNVQVQSTVKTNDENIKPTQYIQQIQANVPAEANYNQYDSFQNDQTNQNVVAPVHQQASQHTSFSGTQSAAPQISSQHYQITETEKKVFNGGATSTYSTQSHTPVTGEYNAIAVNKQTTGPVTAGFYVQSSQNIQNIPQQFQVSGYKQITSNLPQTQGQYISNTEYTTNDNTNVGPETIRYSKESINTNLPTVEQYKQEVNVRQQLSGQNSNAGTTRYSQESVKASVPTVGQYKQEISIQKQVSGQNSNAGYNQNVVHTTQQQTNRYSTTGGQGNLQQTSQVQYTPETNQQQYSQKNFGQVNSNIKGGSTLISKTEERLKVSAPAISNRQSQFTSFTATKGPTITTQHLQVSKTQGQAGNGNFGQVQQKDSTISNNYKESTFSQQTTTEQKTFGGANYTTTIYKTTHNDPPQLISKFNSYTSTHTVPQQQQQYNYESTIKHGGNVAQNSVPVQSKHQQLLSIQKQFGGSNIPSPFMKSAQNNVQQHNVQQQNVQQHNVQQNKKTSSSLLTSTQTTFPTSSDVQITRAQGTHLGDRIVDNSQFQFNKGTTITAVKQPAYIVQQLQPTQQTYSQRQQQNTRLNTNEYKQANQVQVTKASSFNQQPTVSNTFQQTQNNYVLPSSNTQNTQYKVVQNNAQYSAQGQNVKHKNIAQGYNQQTNQYQQNTQTLPSTSTTVQAVRNSQQKQSSFQSHRSYQKSGHNHQTLQPVYPLNADVRLNNQQNNVQTAIPNLVNKAGYTRVEFVPALGFAIDSDHERQDYLSAVSGNLNLGKTYLAPYQDRAVAFTSGGFTGLAPSQGANFNNFQSSHGNSHGFQTANFDSQIRTATGFGSGNSYTPSFNAPQISYDNSRLGLGPIGPVHMFHQQNLPIENYGYPKIKPSIPFNF